LTLRRLQIAFALHAMQQRIQGPRTKAVAVTAEFPDHLQAEYIFLAGMIENMQPNESEKNGPVFHIENR
jgi:hypothetical protein